MNQAQIRLHALISVRSPLALRRAWHAWVSGGMQLRIPPPRREKRSKLSRSLEYHHDALAVVPWTQPGEGPERQRPRDQPKYQHASRKFM